VLRVPAVLVHTTGQQGRGVTYLKEKSRIERAQPVAPEARQAAMEALAAVAARRMKALGLA
jgi:hypothetical protein